MSADHTAQNKRPYQSVSWLLVILTASVFITELLVMLFLNMLPPMSKIAGYLMDASLLTVLIFPIFYLFFFRPLVHSLDELRLAEDNLRIVSLSFESKEPILITDAQTNILRANKAFLNMTGYTQEEITGKHPRIFRSGRYDDDYYRAMWKKLISNGSWSGDIRIKDKRGYTFPVGIVITAVKDEQGEVTHYVAGYSL